MFVSFVAYTTKIIIPFAVVVNILVRNTYVLQLNTYISDISKKKITMKTKYSLAAKLASYGQESCSIVRIYIVVLFH